MAENIKGDSPPQVEKFCDLARELECDDSEAAFDEKLKRLAKAKPADGDYARAQLAEIEAKIARLDTGNPEHTPNDDGLRVSLESQKRTWLAVLKDSN